MGRYSYGAASLDWEVLKKTFVKEYLTFLNV